MQGGEGILQLVKEKKENRRQKDALNGR